MNLFKTKPTVTPTATEQNNEEVTRQLKADRVFWDNCVHFSINEDDTSSQTVARSLDIADRLLAARRERFPVKE